MGCKKRTRVASPKDIAGTTLVSQAIRSATTQPSPSFAAGISHRDVKGATVARRGPLRGLDPKNVLLTPATQSRHEVANSDDELVIMDDEEASCEPPRSTRAARSGRQQVNYDMKYHPMDEVTRPKRAAKRTPASRQPKTPVKIDVGTSDASSNIDLDLLSGEDESELESDNKENELARKPDPRATRHSARSEARKAVNYSRKHHPQDHGLPGFQRRAKRIKLEHSNAVRKKTRPGVSLEDENTGGLQQGNNGPNEGHSGIQEDDDQQMGTLDDLSIDSHSQSSERNEEGRPNPKSFASFKDDHGSALMKDAEVANSTDNEFAHGGRVIESRFEQSDEMDFEGLFVHETIEQPEPQTSSLAASTKIGGSLEKQPHLTTDDVSLTIVKPYFSGYQGYVLHPREVQFEISKVERNDNSPSRPSQPQDSDQLATGGLVLEADATSVIDPPKESPCALSQDQGAASQAEPGSKGFASLEESVVNDRRASSSPSSNILPAVDDSNPEGLIPSLNVNAANEGREGTHVSVPVSAQSQLPPAEDADAHDPPSAYHPEIHVQHEELDDNVSSLLPSLGQDESNAIRSTTEDDELPSTDAQSFASAEETNELPPSGQGDQ
ncbi:hypothetical protein KC351_g9464 [Hortaea werneckii]|nr:hypothetical protein KC351_g9464 [Hortaea werneckii]